MTIIIARDREMGADTAVWCGSSTIGSHQKKIHRLPDGSLVGVAGAPGFAQWFVNWLAKRCDREFSKWPRDSEPPIDPEIGFAAIWLRSDGSRVRFNGSTLPYLDMGAYSVAGGDGVPLAVGAIEAGASIRQAIEIAIRCGDSAGGDIHVEHLPPALAEAAN